MNIYIAVVSAACLVFIAYWFVSALSAKKNVGRNWHWLWMRLIVIIIAVALLKFGKFSHIDVQYSAYVPGLLGGSIGAALCVIGVAFAIWARVHIGRNWGMPMSVKEEPELVMSGPYEYVRHPIYSGLLLATLGSVLVAGSWWLAVLAFVCVYFMYSATQEEKLMLKTFPNQYPEYQKRSKMVIPFVF